MKWGFYINPQKGEPVLSFRAKSFIDATKTLLVSLTFKRGEAPDFMVRTRELTNLAKKTLGLTGQFFYVYNLDVLGNTITVCPPIITEEGAVEFDPNKYEKYVRDEYWPVEIIDCETLSGIGALMPKLSIGLPEISPVKTSHIQVVK